jgi:hypothetical protein
MKNQSDALRAALTAEKICAPAKIAVSSSPARAAIAVKQARNLKGTGKEPIFATGFLWTLNSGLRARRQKK